MIIHRKKTCIKTILKYLKKRGPFGKETVFPGQAQTNCSNIYDSRHNCNDGHV
jgi:hypothetical protein